MLRYFFLIFFAAATIWMLSLTYSIGIANAYFFQVKDEFEYYKKQSVVTQADFNSTLETMNYVLLKDPSNPHYWHIYGKLLHWGVYKTLLDQEKLLDAKQSYLKSLEIRTSWPMVWIDLALINSSLVGFNEETLSYVVQANKYGPFEYEVLMGTIEIYLRYWDALQDHQKDQAFVTLNKLAQFGYQFAPVFDLAKSVNRSLLVCSYTKYSKVMSEIRMMNVYKKNCI